MPSATSSNTHIPAWKRLGLKLKSTTNNPQPNSLIEAPAQLDLRKRKRSIAENSPISRELKETLNPASEPTDREPITPSLSHKKSVTFTPETKAEDGDSIKQLFNSWAADQKAQDPTWQLKTSNPIFKAPISAQVEEVVDPTLDEKERRVKRIKSIPKTAKSPKKAKTPKNTTSSTRPFLRYLRQYHESRETWKFNKNHQSHLLKHIFNIGIIPSDHAHLIYPYVRGLKGSVRTRLRDEALAVKIKDIEDGVTGFPAGMADPDKRQAEYEACMKDYVATKTVNNPELSLDESGFEEGMLMGLSDVAMKERVAKRIRAESILEELASSSDSSQTETNNCEIERGVNLKRLRMNDGSAQKVPRKRKQRTATAEESSSDSSSDSSDSSSEDEAAESNDRSSDSTSSSSSSSDESSSSSSTTGSSGSSSSENDNEERSSDGSSSDDESDSDNTDSD